MGATSLAVHSRRAPPMPSTPKPVAHVPGACPQAGSQAEAPANAVSSGPLQARSHSSSVQSRPPACWHSSLARERVTEVSAGFAGSLGYGLRSMENAPSSRGSSTGSRVGSRPRSPGVLPAVSLPAGMSTRAPAAATARAPPATARSFSAASSTLPCGAIATDAPTSPASPGDGPEVLPHATRATPRSSGGSGRIGRAVHGLAGSGRQRRRR